MNPKVRLQKVLAEAGLASRRACERLILEGRVVVNGRTVTQLGTKVDPGSDAITVDGQPVHGRRKLYLALHKPRGYLCSRSDPQSRKTVSALLPNEWAPLHTVGRLDLASEGLLFLTNDGEFTLRLTHPRFGVLKKYRATVAGKIPPAAVARLTGGIVHGGDKLKAEQARLLEASPSQSVVELDLREGKNREVRRLFQALGFEVLALKRVQIGPIKLGELPLGRWRALTPSEVAALMKSPAPAPRRKPAPRQG